MDKVIPRDALGDYEEEPFDVVRLYECLQDEEFRKQKLYIATDGGAIPDIGSLGFLLTDSEGNPFITCYGQPAGYEPKSYRCEICAALAAVRLLRLYIEYFDGRFEKDVLSQSITIHIYTDSESMITKLNKMKEYPTAKHKMTLHPEWDVLSALGRITPG